MCITQIELPSVTQKMLSLGAIKINETMTKQMTLVNRSPIPLTLALSLMASTSSCELGEQLTVYPTEDIELEAKKGKCNFTITFSPKSRISYFQEEVRQDELIDFKS